MLLVLTNSHKCICSKASRLLIKKCSLARDFEELPVPVLIVGKEKEEAVMNQEKRNSISVILKDVEKFMAKHLTYEHIFAGILEKDLLYATGCFVAKDLQGVMSFRDIEELIQVKRDLNVQNVLKDLCGVIISPNMSKRTRIKKGGGTALAIVTSGELDSSVTEVLGSPRIVTVAAISQDSNPATPNVSTNMEEF